MLVGEFGVNFRWPGFEFRGQVFEGIFKFECEGVVS